MISQYIQSLYLSKLSPKSEALDKLQAEREALRVRAQSYKGRAQGRVIPKARQMDAKIYELQNPVLSKLEAERDALRKRAQSYKGDAKGRMTPRAYEVENEIKRLKNPSLKDKLKFIGGGKPIEKTFGDLFADYLEDLAQIENLRNIFTFSSLQSFVDNASATISEAQLGFTEKSRAQKELTKFITAVLDDYSFKELEQNLQGKKRKFYPPLNSFLYKLPPVEFAERAQMLSEARTPTDDIFVSARDTVELYYTNSESAPTVVVKFEASGFNTPEIDEEKMFKGVDAGEGFALVEDKSLSPRYGYSDEYFSVVARLDFANHKHGQKIFLVKLQYQYVWSEKGKTNHKKAK